MREGLLARFPRDPVEWALTICDWYKTNQRDLPWRRAPDPYRVWLSEIMLQQTQVKTALPYYKRFLEAYPRLEDLADAEEAAVLDLWAGLGYYSRARNLHHCARRVKDEFQGVFPDRLEDLLELPGIGRYSAGAILSIAFDQAHPVVDGNVKRVMTRYLAATDGLAPSSLWSALETLVSETPVARRISDFNQGLMELGALVCTPRNPDCTACPLEPDCLSRQAGTEKAVPRASRKTRTVDEVFTVVVIQDSGGFLMTRNDVGPYLKGFWEFPKVEGRLSEDELAAAVRSQHGIRIRPGPTFREVRHSVTFRRLHFLPVLAEPLQQEIPAALRWGVPGAPGFPVSAYIHKITALIPEFGGPGPPNGPAE